ncbi:MULTISPECIES: tetratricopeptide repeat protein [unclassified Pseudomonas]|uniref:tetratricopeptide repeat protein n=1 Tax=unclassified Pseudomonas TaxID=196821 RepID=UPI000C885312|nr:MULTISPECIES: tetratricopeptide repeat protein [unclassified Pseudomonas]PMX27486.1 sel1 repeat family protein [Pseudomonas sp. GW460-12]PMX29194.1 sel1 repeat family protein [Pseudomonas sp. MPR-R2A4]PMX41853.1 sel1 repeat family protein [Pseudomonas sp. MPR-R2A7]PMX46790.1 sel1 repeat family protein [Pseudomonas sp. MPR-R2A6]PMX91290.1 sel1 repeat family protein [Pseudomonas sp. MPR-R2A3]
MSSEHLLFQLPLIMQIQACRVTADQLRDTLSRNPRDAARWCSAAAKAGFPAAQVVLGQLLLDGRGVKRDAHIAFTWFERAADAGDIEACNMMGRCYEQGWGVPTNPQRAIEAFEIAAQAGHAWGQVNLAQMLMRAGDPADRPRCFVLFKAAAESGTTKPHLKAMNSLARFLEEGWAGLPDPAGAAFWYLRAANLGDHWAQYNLATILFRQGDQETADQWLRSAIVVSDNGFRRRIAPLLLARPEMELRQCGLDALARCAEGKAPNDLYAYGLALNEGVAGARDPAKATALFKAAAAQGHAQAAELIRPKSKFGTIRRLADQALTVVRHSPDFTGSTPLSNGEHHEN